MSPINTVIIWLQSGIAGNSVLSTTPNLVTILTYGEGIGSYFLKYNTHPGQFVNGSGVNASGHVKQWDTFHPQRKLAFNQTPHLK